MRIIGYKLSDDGKGLLAFFKEKNGQVNYYHIHSDEFTGKQKEIHLRFNN